MPRFADDHPIDVLRGRDLPKPSSVRYVLGRRAAWLLHKIQVRRARGLEWEIQREELAATIMAVEALEKQQPGIYAESFIERVHRNMLQIRAKEAKPRDEE